MENPVQTAPLERICQRLAQQLDSGIGVACSGITGDVGQLYPEELTAVSRAVPKRQREFATGRANARTAMTRMGAAASCIPSGPDRAPVWPPGLIGSISHTDTACVAVVGRRTQMASIGIDLEDDLPIDQNLWPTICTPAETAHLRAQPLEWQGRLVTRLFSAKEAVYKWQYPLTGCMLDFQQVQVTWLSNNAEPHFFATLDGVPLRLKPKGQCFMDAGCVVSWACTP